MTGIRHPGLEFPARHAGTQLQKHHPFRSNQSFEPLPTPTGPAPYRVDLEALVGADEARRITESGELHLHVAGDTGGVKHPVPQQVVAMQMAADFAAKPAERPALFYHLGDVVYFFGEASEYYPQFYEAYADYPAPIVAIPGNHDGDRADAKSPPSLEA